MHEPIKKHPKNSLNYSVHIISLRENTEWHFHQIYDILFVYDVIKTSCFFLRENSSWQLDELSSRGILSVISAYWNPWYTPCIAIYTLLIWFKKQSDKENTFSNGVLSSFLCTVMLETKRQGLQGYGWVIIVYVRGISIKTILK